MKSTAVAPAENESQPTAARVEQITSLFTTMIQALRALQLYGPSNLTTQRAIDTLRSGFGQVWKQEPQFEVEVHPDALMLAGRPVCPSTSQTESIAFLMFRDGIRSLSFREGFELEELPRFLALLHRARYEPTESDDLVTLLWDEDFLHLRHGYIDVDATTEEAQEAEAEVVAATADDPVSRVLTRHIHDANAWAVANAGYDANEYPGSADPPALPVAAASMQRHTLQLDPEALVYLQRELEEEMRRDIRQDVANALLDSLEVPDRKAQAEILQTFAVVIPQLLAERQLRLVAGVLGELRALTEQPEILDEECRREVDNLFAKLFEASAVQDFFAALEAGDVQSDLDCIESFVVHFGATMLPRLLRIREKAAGKELRAVLESATERLARGHRDAASECLRSEDSLIVRGALRILVGLGAAETIPEIVGLLDHADTRVRLGAVEVLVALGAGPGLEALLRVLDDGVREVRIAALWGLATWQHTPALARLERDIDSKAFRECESDEMMAVLDAYARIGGEGAVERLGRLLNARALLKPKEPSELRACAARALGSVGGSEAKAQLERAQDDRDPEVRRAAQRSLRKVGQS